MHIYILTINQTKLIYYWILTFLKFKYITFVSNYAFVLSHCEFLTTDKNCFEIPGAGCVNDLYVYIQKPCVRLFPRHTHYIIIKEEYEYFTYSIIHLTESMRTHVFCCESIEFYASGAWRPKVIVVCLSQRCFDDFKLAWTELRSVKRIKTSSS